MKPLYKLINEGGTTHVVTTLVYGTYKDCTVIVGRSIIIVLVVTVVRQKSVRFDRYFEVLLRYICRKGLAILSYRYQTTAGKQRSGNFGEEQRRKETRWLTPGG